MSTLFSDQDKKLVEAAVKEAESRTSGEIVPVVVDTSGDYSFVGHRLGMLGVVLATILMWLLPHSQNLFWEFTLVFAVQGCGWLLGWLLGQVPAVVRLLAGQGRMQTEVHESALASFLLNGLHRTKDRTGILVFISCLEHKVEIVADQGIHAVAGEGFWKKEVEAIAGGIRRGEGATVLAQTIREMGDKLAEHFPVKPGDRNELPNGVRSR